MSNIGSVSPDSNGVLFGWISTLSFDREVGLRAVENRGPLSPLYDIMAKSDAGRWVAVGAFWERRSELTGRTYLSGKVDAPELRSPLYIAGFAQENGSYAIAWSRTDSAAGGMGRRGRGDERQNGDGRSDESRSDERSDTGHDDGLGESTAPGASRNRRQEPEQIAA